MGDFGLSLVKLAKFEDEEGTKVGGGGLGPAWDYSCVALLLRPHNLVAFRS